MIGSLLGFYDIMFVVLVLCTLLAELTVDHQRPAA